MALIHCNMTGGMSGYVKLQQNEGSVKRNKKYLTYFSKHYNSQSLDLYLTFREILLLLSGQNYNSSVSESYYKCSPLL